MSKKFFDACAIGDVETIIKLRDADDDLSIQNNRGLSIVVKNGHLPLINLLLAIENVRLFEISNNYPTIRQAIAIAAESHNIIVFNSIRRMAEQLFKVHKELIPADMAVSFTRLMQKYGLDHQTTEPIEPVVLLNRTDIDANDLPLPKDADIGPQDEIKAQFAEAKDVITWGWRRSKEVARARINSKDSTPKSSKHDVAEGDEIVFSQASNTNVCCTLS